MNYLKDALTVGILNCSYIHGVITRRYVSVHLESLAKLIFGICLLILQCTGIDILSRSKFVGSYVVGGEGHVYQLHQRRKILNHT